MQNYHERFADDQRRRLSSGGNLQRWRRQVDETLIATITALHS